MQKNLNLRVSQLSINQDLDDISLKKPWEEENKEDNFKKEILTLFRTRAKYFKIISLSDSNEVDSRLFIRNRQYVSEHVLLQTRLIKECHDWLAFGHLKGTNTYTLISSKYW